MGFEVLDNYECEGQLSFDDVFFEKEIKGELFAVSRVFAEARKQMTLAEYKAFSYALTKVKFKEECPDTLYLDKKELAQAVGIHSDTDHLSQDLFRAIGDMPNHSFIKISDKHKGLYASGNFIRTLALFKNVVRLRIETDYLSMFGNLDGTINSYITMWSTDIYKMRSERSVIFYEFLRDHSDTRKINDAALGVKYIKDLFDMSKEDYCRADGKFDRYGFEKRILDPLCEDMSKCQMINLIKQEDGKYYKKEKKGNRIVGYRFYWTVSTSPQIVSADEIEEIREAERQDPELRGRALKIEADIVKGKKKAEKSAIDKIHEDGFERDLSQYKIEDFL